MAFTLEIKRRSFQNRTRGSLLNIATNINFENECSYTVKEMGSTQKTKKKDGNMIKHETFLFLIVSHWLLPISWLSIRWLSINWLPIRWLPVHGLLERLLLIWVLVKSW